MNKKNNLDKRSDDDFFDLQLILSLIYSQKKIVIFSVISSFIFTTFITFLRKPTWQGQFQIVIANVKGSGIKNTLDAKLFLIRYL